MFQYNTQGVCCFEHSLGSNYGWCSIIFVITIHNCFDPRLNDSFRTFIAWEQRYV